MTISAVVYSERHNLVVRVNKDGHPSRMIPLLNRIVEQGLEDAFVAGVEYNYLAEDDEQYSQMESLNMGNYKGIPRVGLAFNEPVPTEMRLRFADGLRMFKPDAAYHYQINVDGSVFLLGDTVRAGSYDDTDWNVFSFESGR